MATNPAEPNTLGVVSALIIDDNAFDRRRFLRLANDTDIEFFVREAHDPESFGRQLDEDRYDVIFIDLDLAGPVTGFDLLPVIRGHRTNAKAALIMVAGQDQAEIALHALRSGFSDYIDKGNLSASSLERATVNAVQKTKLKHVADSASAESRSMEKVLKSFADACTKEMRPMLVRMVRQVRQMKGELETAGVSSMNVTSVEQTCARMDEFLQDLGSLANDQALSEIVSGTVASNASLPPRPTPPEQVPVPEPEATPRRVRSKRISAFGKDR